MAGFTGFGRTFFVDNFYASMPLASRLLKEDTFICGTLRSNRKRLPKQVTEGNAKKGEVIGFQSQDGVKVLKWMDKRSVLMISKVAQHDDSLLDTGKTTWKGEPIMKRRAVLDYNAVKKGVDYTDQMTSYYSGKG